MKPVRWVLLGIAIGIMVLTAFQVWATSPRRAAEGAAAPTLSASRPAKTWVLKPDSRLILDLADAHPDDRYVCGGGGGAIDGTPEPGYAARHEDGLFIQTTERGVGVHCRPGRFDTVWVVKPGETETLRPMETDTDDQYRCRGKGGVHGTPDRGTGVGNSGGLTVETADDGTVTVTCEP